MIRFTVALLGLAALVLPNVAAAERLAPPPDVNSPDWSDPDAPATTTEAEDLAKIEAYMDGIRTLRARFNQIAPDQYVSSGTMSLEKPGKLRFEYEPPSPLLVVSNGSAITLVDYDLKQVTRWPINDTPLRPLVKAELAFGTDVEVVKMERRAGWIRVSVVDPKNRDEGTMRLVFSRDPFELTQWEVVDERGQVTVVAIDDIEKNIALDKSLWDFDDPRPKRRLPGKR